MKNKLLLICCLAHFCFAGFSQSDSLPSSVTNWNVGAGYFRNLTYGYGGASIFARTPQFAFNNKGGVGISYDGFRMIKPLIGEYSRINLEADYLVPLQSKLEYLHALQVRGGLSAIVDLTNAFSRFGTAARLGVDYTGQLNKMIFSLNNTFTFFADGLWIEPVPGVAYNLFKCFYVKVDMMVPVALTYNGHADVGYHARINIMFLL